MRDLSDVIDVGLDEEVDAMSDIVHVQVRLLVSGLRGRADQKHL